MELITIGTGSKGNAYILTSGSASLVLDAGIRWLDIVTNKAFNARNTEAVLITHEHMDHFRAADDFVNTAIPTYASQGTWEAMARQTSFYRRAAAAGRLIETDHFFILPFATEHDAAEPLGYLIKAIETGETLVYATDTYYLRHTFPGVHYWLIECNYCHDIMHGQALEGHLSLAQRKRLVSSHMSLEHLLEAFKANDMTHTRQIIICHLSDQRSDEVRMIKEIEKETGKPCTAARNGETVQLAFTPF